MRLGVPVERRKHNGKNFANVLADQVQDVLIVPIIQGALSHLKVWALNAACDLLEEGDLNFLELLGLNDI